MPLFRSCACFYGFASTLLFQPTSVGAAVAAVQASVAVVDIDEGVVSLLQHSVQKWQKGQMNAWRRKVAAAALDPQYVSEHPPSGQEEEYLIEEAAMQLREELAPKKSKIPQNGMGKGMGQSRTVAEENSRSKDQHLMKDSATGDRAENSGIAAIQDRPPRFNEKASARLEKRWRREVAAAATDPQYAAAHPAVAAVFGEQPHANLVEEAATRMREQLVQGLGTGMGTGMHKGTAMEAPLSALQLGSHANLPEHHFEASRHMLAAVPPIPERKEDASVSFDTTFPRESIARTLATALAMQETKHTGFEAAGQ